MMRPYELLIVLLCLIHLGVAIFLPYGHGGSKRQTGCTNPSVRLEWRNMPDDEKLAYVEAERCLFQRSAMTGLPGASNRMEDLAAVHQYMTRSIHRDGIFLPWHRFMMYAHETLLRYECGYGGHMPWWDETRDAGRFQYAPIFTSQYFGTSWPGPPRCVVDGAFGNINLTVGPGFSVYSHCITRAIDEHLSESITVGYINLCNRNREYGAMYKCVFDGPHGYGHDAVGGVMADVDSSPGDPVFYLHHAMVDRNWRAWQLADPMNRMFAVSGPDTQGCAPNCTLTTLDTPLDIYNLVPGVRVQDVMDTQGGFLCYTYDY